MTMQHETYICHIAYIFETYNAILETYATYDIYYCNMNTYDIYY
jgi:hypothetical protein